MGFPVLSVIVFLPVAVGVALLFLKDHRQIQLVAAGGTALDLVLSLVALGFYVGFVNSGKDFNLQEKFAWLPDLKIGYHMGVDIISILLVVLTTLLTLISVLVSWDPIQKRV